MFAFRRLLAILALVALLATQATANAEPTTAPGTVEFVGALRNDQWTPWASSSQKVTYWTVGANGEPMLSNAALYIPEGDPPPGGWPVIARAHGTTGIGDECAPTYLGWGQQLAITSAGSCTRDSPSWRPTMPGSVRRVFIRTWTGRRKRTA
ncbi:hypothetical protein [Antrihabitans stalactiti]|uniref:hypothetical protein n=1 Tax=Antrihabitans stalactiti TaxID=2584121 RepID=UPI001F115448|nr:hypothetical protein [Antrihabitans stalactiti]